MTLLYSYATMGQILLGTLERFTASTRVRLNLSEYNDHHLLQTSLSRWLHVILAFHMFVMGKTGHPRMMRRIIPSEF